MLNLFQPKINPDYYAMFGKELQSNSFSGQAEQFVSSSRGL